MKREREKRRDWKKECGLVSRGEKVYDWFLKDMDVIMYYIMLRS